MARLPTPGSDDGSWGDILNNYLSQSLASDGTLKPNSVTSSQLASGSVVSASLAPDSVTTTALADGSVVSTRLADNSVISTKLADAAVTNAKLDAPTKASLTKADSAVQGTDPRLTDARTPTAHTHTASAISDSTAVGRSLITATDLAAAQSALSLLSTFALKPTGTPTGSKFLRDDNSWQTVSGGGGGVLDDLIDVATAGQSTGKGLIYNGSSWVPSGSAVVLASELACIDAVIRWDGTGSQPLRSTVTSDTSRRVRWVCPTAPSQATGYALAGDVWEQTP